MHCPPDARVYWNEAWIGCAIPGMPGVSLPISHGLQLGFRSDGALASQTFYERGLVRWAIQYHTTGARESAGFYASTEPLSYPPHGLHTRWAPNGRIVAQATFVAGRQHGWQKLWEDDGYPIGATRFVDGRIAEQVYPDPSRTRS
jgi:antitoxin component YwqK of YwqJK toxin-antitoxin module